jgi:hypothetical protein
MFSGYIAIGAAVLILLLGGIGYMQYERANSLLKTTASQKAEIEQKEAVIGTLTNGFVRNQQKLDFIEQKINIIHSNSVAQTKTFDSHDFGKLLDEKPGLIENIVNKATEKALKRITDITDPNWTPK